MSKPIPEGTPVTIIKQLRLSPAQKLAIVSASNTGGKFDRGPEWGIQQTLRHLRLIEQRPRYSPDQAKKQQAKLAALWKEFPALVRAKNAHAVNRKAGEILSLQRDLEGKEWWLTAEAQEYLTKGRVTITL